MERLLKNLTDNELMELLPKCEEYNNTGIVSILIQDLNSYIKNRIGSQSMDSGSYLTFTIREIYRETALRWRISRIRHQEG